MGDGGMRRGLHGRAVLGVDHPAADEAADLVGREVGPGENCERAGHGGGRLGVDRLDPGVGVGRAKELDKGLPGTIDVVGVLSLPGDETEILLAPHRGADPGRTHEDASLD